MEIEDQGLKVIHWEFHKEMYQGSIKEGGAPSYKMMFVTEPGTKKTIGVLFRWTTRVYTTLGLAMSCVVEQVYIITPVDGLKFPEGKELIQIAFKSFNSELEKRSKEAGIRTSVIYSVKDHEVSQLLFRLARP